MQKEALIEDHTPKAGGGQLSRLRLQQGLAAFSTLSSKRCHCVGVIGSVSLPTQLSGHGCFLQPKEGNNARWRQTRDRRRGVASHCHLEKLWTQLLRQEGPPILGGGAECAVRAVQQFIRHHLSHPGTQTRYPMGVRLLVYKSILSTAQALSKV